jgi:signal transduction histidine kinase
MGFKVSKLTTEDGRLGVIGLKDRIESLRGEFKFNSVLGIGTALKLLITLPELKQGDV